MRKHKKEDLRVLEKEGKFYPQWFYHDKKDDGSGWHRLINRSPGEHIPGKGRWYFLQNKIKGPSVLEEVDRHWLWGPTMKALPEYRYEIVVFDTLEEAKEYLQQYIDTSVTHTLD